MEWTPEQWQAHVTDMEKRMNELEREVYQLKEAQGTPLSRMGSNLEKIAEYNRQNASNAPRLGEAWIA